MSQKRLIHCFALTFFMFAIALLLEAQNPPKGNAEFFMYEDTTASLLFKTISDSAFDANFKPIEKNAFWHDVTKSSIWIKFTVSDLTQDQRYLELTTPNFDEVTYYQPLSTWVNEYKAGLLVPFDERPIKIDRFVFPISQSNNEHYIKIRTTHFINTEFHIKSLQEVTNDAALRNLLYNAYVGLMLAIICGVFFYIFLIRHFTYLYYVGYVLFASSVILIERAFYFQILWPTHPVINSYFPLLPFGITIFMLLFLSTIWGNHKIVKILYRISLWGLTIPSFLVALYFFLHDRLGETGRIAELHSIVVSFLVIIICFISYARAEKSFKLQIILINTGFCILCISIIIFLLQLIHVVPTNFFTENIIIFGSTTEVCFLTAALVIRSDEIYKKQKLKLSQQSRYR